MKNRFILLLSLMGMNLSIHCFSQNTTLDPSSIPTPNQSTLGSYGTIPVSNYTGKADLNIPIYSTTQRGVDLDVRLSYDTSGFLINQLPGWTGHNWTLMAGGAITRKINDRPDEIDMKGTNTGFDYFTYYETNGTVKNKDESADSYTNYFKNALHDRVNLDSNLNMRGVDRYDSSADVFYFNFMGISGSFFFGTDGNWKVVCDKNIDVIFDVNDQSNYIESFEEYYPNGGPKNSKGESMPAEFIIKQPKTIKGFTLVDEDGNKYFFGGDKSSIEYSMPLVSAAYEYNTTQPWNAVSWMLKEVQNRFGNVLYSFNYSRGKFIAQIQNAYNTMTATETSEDVKIIGGEHSYFKSCSGTLNAPVYLDSIRIIDGTNLKFEHSNVFSTNPAKTLYPYVNTWSMIEDAHPELALGDGTNFWGTMYYPLNDEFKIFVHSYTDIEKCMGKMNLEELDAITIDNVKDQNGNNPKRYLFGYSFNNRMHLQSLILDTHNKYLFEYDRFDQLPSDYLTKEFDNWGYYNGINYDAKKSAQASSSDDDQTAVEYIKSATSGVKEPRIPDFDYGTMGMLKKIIYPTGGYSLFEYEQNSCSQYMSDDKKNVITLKYDIPAGGLRIKSIENHDDDMIVSRKSFEYKMPVNGLSSGEIYSIPNSNFIWKSDYTDEDKKTYHQKYVVDMMCSVVPLSNSFSSSLGYSYVTENDADGSSTSYTYSNFSTEKDEMFLKSRFGTNTISAFDETSSRRYMCGKLRSEVKTDKNGELVQQNLYGYDSDYDFNKDHYVITTSLSKIDNFVGVVGSVYKMFYFNSGLKNIVKTIRYGNSYVTDTMNYDRKYTPLTVTLANGKSHTVDIFKTTSESLKRQDFVENTVYSYPYLENSINHDLVNQFCLPVTSTKRYINGSLVSGSKVAYGSFNNNSNIAPQYIYEFAGDETNPDTVEQYISYYPNFLVKEIVDKNGINHQFAWNKYDQMVTSVANGSSDIKMNENLNEMKSSNKSDIFTSKPTLANLYSYDSQGRMASTLDKNGENTDYSYDQFGRLTKVQVYDETKLEYSYHNRPSSITLDDDFGIYDKSSLTIPSSSGREGYIQIEYKLRYDLKNAEIRMYYVTNNDYLLASVIIPNNSKKGSVWIKIDPDWNGPCKICLYVDGNYVCDADTRLSFKKY